LSRPAARISLHAYAPSGTAKRPQQRPHQRSPGSNVLGLELSLKVVQSRLGHASVQMTADRYGHLFPRGDDKAELAAAEKAFLG
jgi:integrase